EHYEKGKRQNRLRDGEDSAPNDIEKIVNTYKNRTEEDRYSRRVSMEEIEKNGYNLNISRYVSTAVAEEEIDLKEVHEKLLKIEKKAEDARKRHNEFLRELGLEGV